MPRRIACVSSVCLLIFVWGTIACTPGAGFNPGDPVTEEFFLQKALECALGQASCPAAVPEPGPVSVAVSGLSGSLTATLNGSETITVGADGSSAFFTALNPGDSFTVTVDTMPIPQVCLASNATGTVPDSNMVQVDINCKSVIYAAGAFTTYRGNASSRIARMETNGAIDADFNVGTGLTGGGGTVRALLVDPLGSGKVYVGGGFTDYNGTAVNRILRLNVDGTIDSSFSTGTGFDAEVWSIAGAPDGSGDIYVVGDFANYDGVGSVRIIRLNSDGTRDTAFNVGTGIVGAAARRVIATADGSNDIYVVGEFNTYNGTAYNNLIRLNEDGTHDGAFNLGAGFGGGPARYAALSTDGSGDLYVAGGFITYQGVAQERITRINPDGTRDAAFAIANGCDGDIAAVAAANDGSGDVYVAGPFGLCNGGGNTAGMARFNPDGSIDAGFPVTGGGATEFIRPSPAGDGDIYVTGFPSAFNGTNTFGLFRVNSDATLDAAFDNGGTGLDNTGFIVAP